MSAFKIPQTLQKCHSLRPRRQFTISCHDLELNRYVLFGDDAVNFDNHKAL